MTLYRRALGSDWEFLDDAVRSAHLYGAMLACLVPELRAWWAAPSSLAPGPQGVPDMLRWLLTGMAAGVFLSGMRDLYAALGLPHGSWPWGASTASVSKVAR